MRKYKIAIGCDHTSISSKNQIIDILIKQGHQLFDCGTYNTNTSHYPVYGREVSLRVVQKQADFGIVICGTGIGIANAANKVKNARCILAENSLIVKIAREQYNANILAMGGRIIGIGKMLNLIDTFLNTDYKNVNDTEIKLINDKIPKLISDPNLFEEIINNWYDGHYTNGIKQSKLSLPKKDSDC